MGNYDWPPKHTLQWTFEKSFKKEEGTPTNGINERHEAFIMGHMGALSKYIGSSVIFAFKKDPDIKLDEDNIEILYNARYENETGSNEHPPRLPELCRKFQVKYGDGKCTNCNKVNMLAFFKGIESDSLDPNQFKKVDIGDEGLHYYKYNCSPLNLEKWIFPIYVGVSTYIGDEEMSDSTFVGCFMACAFGTPNPSGKNEKKWLDGLDSSLRVDNTPDKNKQKGFCEHVTRININIGTIHRYRKESVLLEIQDYLTGMLKKRTSSANSSEDPNDWTVIEKHIEETRRSFVATIIEYKRIFNVDTLVVFIKESNPTSKNAIKGIMIGDNNKCGNEFYLSSQLKEHTTDLQQAYDGYKDTLIPSTCNDNTSRNKCTQRIRNLLSGSSSLILEDLSNSALIICRMEHFDEFPVACFINSNNIEDLLKKSKPHTPYFDIFNNICVAFLYQVNALESHKNHLMFKYITQHYEHEVGLASATFNNAFHRLFVNFRKSLNFKGTEILDEYPYLPRGIRLFYEKAEARFEKLELAQQAISAAIGSSVVWDKKRLAEKEYIKPYGDLMQMIYETFRLEANNKKQYFVTPSIHEIEDREEIFPWLHVNRFAILQALYNLTKNAIKYGYEYTNIALDGQASSKDGRDGFEFTITNYGIGIPKQDRQNIFKLGFRSDVAKETDEQSSIGFGLFAAKKIAEAHEGCLELLECKKISDSNIPARWQLKTIDLTYLSTRMQEDFVKLREKYKDTKNTLNDDNLCKKVISQFLLSGKSSSADHFSPLYYDLRLKNPTHKITFRLWIPTH